MVLLVLFLRAAVRVVQACGYGRKRVKAAIIIRIWTVIAAVASKGSNSDFSPSVRPNAAKMNQNRHGNRPTYRKAARTGCICG